MKHHDKAHLHRQAR